MSTDATIIEKPNGDEPEFAPAEAPKPRPGARLVVVEQITWQQDEDDGVPLNNGFAAQIESGERPYLRRLTVGEAGTPLDAGWVGAANAKTVWITNIEGKRQATNPTPEAAAEIAKKVLTVSRLCSVNGELSDIEIAEVPPGQHVRLRLAFPFEWLRVRCEGGSAKVDTAVFAG